MNDIKFGISTASFFGLKFNEDCFDFYKTHNIHVAEVFLSTLSEYQPDFVKLINERKGDLKVHSMHSNGIQYEAELFSGHPRIKADAESMLRTVCTAAQNLGAKFITFHGPLKLKHQPYVHDYKKLSVTINEICDILAEYDLNLSYENIHYGFFNDTNYYEKLITLCPKLYVTIDVKHAVQGGKDPIDFLRVCQDRISTIHLCDVGHDNKPCLPFDGTINFDGIFNHLVKNNIQAPLLLELYSNTYKNGINDILDSYNKLSAKLKNTKGNVISFKNSK